MRSESEPNGVLVIGAGIVGICTALALRQRNLAVTLIDRDDPAAATSFGNAGVISPWACVPQSMPGMMRNVPRWLLDPSGPLHIRARYLPRLAPWLIDFLRAGRPARLPAIADAMLTVNRPALDMYRQLLAGTGEEGLVRDSVYLHVSRKAASGGPLPLAWRMREERGVPVRRLSGDEAREIEPELSPAIRAAMLISDQGRTVNPGRLGQVLARKSAEAGVRIERVPVTAITPKPGGGYLVRTGDGTREALIVVLTAGVWSARLLAPLGVRVRLEAERGYHLIFSDPGITLNTSVMDSDNVFVASSMEMGVRAAGTAEFAGIDAPPDYRRAHIFARHARSLFPNLQTAETIPWMGRRPSTPDSVPCIGEVPGYPGLFCGFGHGHLGLTGAPMTGRMIAALAVGERLNVDMQPYGLDRFA